VEEIGKGAGDGKKASKKGGIRLGRSGQGTPLPGGEGEKRKGKAIKKPKRGLAAMSEAVIRRKLGGCGTKFVGREDRKKKVGIFQPGTMRIN